MKHLKKLKYLNICNILLNLDDTSVTTLALLGKLSTLEIFVCGNNNGIYPHDLINFLEKNQQLKKLSLEHFGGKNTKLLKTSQL